MNLWDRKVTRQKCKYEGKRKDFMHPNGKNEVLLICLLYPDRPVMCPYYDQFCKLGCKALHEEDFVEYVPKLTI